MSACVFPPSAGSFNDMATSSGVCIKTRTFKLSPAARRTSWERAVRRVFVCTINLFCSCGRA